MRTNKTLHEAAQRSRFRRAALRRLLGRNPRGFSSTTGSAHPSPHPSRGGCFLRAPMRPNARSTAHPNPCPRPSEHGELRAPKRGNQGCRCRSVEHPADVASQSAVWRGPSARPRGRSRAPVRERLASSCRVGQGTRRAPRQPSRRDGEVGEVGRCGLRRRERMLVAGKPPPELGLPFVGHSARTAAPEHVAAAQGEASRPR
jgi:hypothetical protein